MLSLKEEVFQTLKREFYNKDNFVDLKDDIELQGKSGLVSDLSKKVAELENALSEMKRDIFDHWFDKFEESSVDKEVKKALRCELDDRKGWFLKNKTDVSTYRSKLNLISQRISELKSKYRNPTFEQTKKFTKAECEKAIGEGIIKFDNVNISPEWGSYASVEKEVEKSGGNIEKAKKQKQPALAWKLLVSKNRTLFNDPEFVRKIKQGLIDFFDMQLNYTNIDKVCAERFNAMKEVVSKL